jgi:hypothetical protein
MSRLTKWILTRIAKRAAWNFPRNRELHQRQVLLASHRIMHYALTDGIEDHFGVLKEMSQDAHDKVWGRSLRDSAAATIQPSNILRENIRRHL